MTDQRSQPEPAPQFEHAHAILEVIGSRQVDVIIGTDGLSYVRAKDVHDLERRNEAALRRSQQRLHLAIESAYLFCFEWDIQRNEVRRGLSNDPTLGPTAAATPETFETVLAVVYPADRDLFKAKVNAALESPEGRYESQFRIVRASGQIAWLQDYGIVERDANGQPTHLIGMTQDITERKRTEESLRQAKTEADRANNAKSRFLAAASHDLRQPLTALSLYAGILKNTPGLSDQELVANMQVCIDSLSELLNDLLDLSKLDAGVVTPFVKDFAIADLFDSLASAHAPEAQVKGLRLRFVACPWTCRTDLVLLRRCLNNLIENALRYTERGGVVVACRRRLGKTWVEVWDSGIGIAAEQTQEIFEEFRQLGDGARNTGSGLGLTIVAKTAALLGLEISVRSRVARGSVFAIELPLRELGASEPAAAESARARVSDKRSLRIALVEDSEIVREALVEVLQRLGHEMLATATGAALLAELDLFEPDILVSDYRLDFGETGFDVITAVRARLGPEFPALLITGDTDPKLLRSMNDRGIFVMHKSLHLETLQATLEKLTRPLG